MRARIVVLGAVDLAMRRHIEGALAGAGVEAADRADTDAATPWIAIAPDLAAGVAATVRELAAGHPDARGIVLTTASSLGDGAWDVLAAGASDVLPWSGVAALGTDVAARLRRWAEIDEVLRSDVVHDNLLGRSAAWTREVRQVVEVARFTQTPILITGESGTGKELIARLVHTLDTRRDKGALVVVDCTTVVPTLSGSEFFGHERGAYTGAVSARDGAMAQADGGTLFLDEVGDLPLPLQAELLRVLQEGTYKRVGSDTWRRSRFRLIAATNRPLIDAQASGAFRSDLYHRLAGWTCELPPLRERTGDIPLLARHFLAELRPEATPEIDPGVLAHLAGRPYPGNVRELRLLVARIAARHVGDGPITLGDLPASERALRPAADETAAGDAGATARSWADALRVGVRRALDDRVGLVEIGRIAKELAIADALAREDGHVLRAARRLDVTARALQARAAGRARRAGASDPRDDAVAPEPAVVPAPPARRAPQHPVNGHAR
jgi:transcriptional regulator with GAF, ATPase, and Fis domain